jgi:hypothetical protein
MTRSIRAPRPVLAVITAITLAACAVEGRPAPETPHAVRLTTEKDGRFLVLAGPSQRHAEPFLGVASTNFFLLRSFIDTQTGAIVHQLYVEDSYPGAERNWNAARLAYGNALRFVAISNRDHLRNSISYAEEFAASLPDELLRTNPRVSRLCSAQTRAPKRQSPCPAISWRSS